MSWVVAAGTMIQNVCAEGKREVSTAQSWKFQGPKSFGFGFPDEINLSVCYFGPFPPAPEFS